MAGRIRHPATPPQNVTVTKLMSDRLRRILWCGNMIDDHADRRLLLAVGGSASLSNKCAHAGVSSLTGRP
jgi:hypothetical protein